MRVLANALSCLLGLSVVEAVHVHLAGPAGARSAGARAKRAASLLEQRAQGNSQMEALALRVGSVATASNEVAPLEGVKDLIRGMLVKAKAAHANDVGLNEFCTSESAHSKEALTTLGDRSEKAQADLDKLSAETDQTTQKIADLHAEIADLQKAVVNSSEARDKNHTAYLSRKAELENEESKSRDEMEKVSNYDSPDAAGERAKLEHAAEDALKRRIKMETEEAAENFHWVREQREDKEQVKVKGETIKHEQRAILRMQSTMVDSKQDFQALKEQLSASKTYAQQIAHKCTVPSDTHAQRAEHRQSQIESLKDAYTILSA